MKSVFFGSSDYCLPILETLKKDLVLVVTRPDKPEGRKQAITPSPVNLWAKKNNIPVITPATLKKDTQDRLTTEDNLIKYAPDYGIVADYGLIIPERVFSLPKQGTFNIHFSRLPDLRGPSPVQFTLLQGGLEAWVTIFRLENPPELGVKMDAGPILSQTSFPILPNDTTESLYTRLFIEAGAILKPMLNKHLEQGKKLLPQDHLKATYCRFLTKEDGFIAWETLQKAVNGDDLKFDELPKIQQEALKISEKSDQATTCPIYSFFQAVTPWPGVWTVNPRGKRVKILESRPDRKKFVPIEIQFEGKKPQPASQLFAS